MRARTLLAGIAGAAAVVFSIAMAACSNSNAPTENNPDSGSSSSSSSSSSGGSSGSSSGSSSSGGTDGGQDSGPNCFSGTPTTYLEIINACTDAAFVDKHPTLPLLQPDGGLPPLP
jgi:hypothetical protein